MKQATVALQTFRSLWYRCHLDDRGCHDKENTATSRTRLPVGPAPAMPREVLSCAGIDPNERVVRRSNDFVAKVFGHPFALSRRKSEGIATTAQNRPKAAFEDCQSLNKKIRGPTGRVFFYVCLISTD